MLVVGEPFAFLDARQLFTSVETTDLFRRKCNSVQLCINSTLAQIILEVGQIFLARGCDLASESWSRLHRNGFREVNLHEYLRVNIDRKVAQHSASPDFEFHLVLAGIVRWLNRIR